MLSLIHKKQWLIFFLVGCFISPLAQAASENALVVTPSQLQQNQKDWVVLDLRSPENYAKHHIPEALNLPLAQLHRQKEGIDGFILTPKNFKELMEKIGIKNSDTVVLYSDWANLDAARAYWAFDFYGHQSLYILEGGYQAWQKASLPVTQSSTAKPSSRYIVQIQPNLLATKFQTFMATKTQDFLIIDARPAAQYDGDESLTGRKGHIPNAINIPWYTLVTNRTSQDGYNKKTSTSAFDWRKIETELAALPKDKKIILYCNGGQESSILYMGLKKMGKTAAVYDGSWFEWSMDDKMPVMTKN